MLTVSQQEESKKPLTPYADLAFKDGIVVYTVSQNQALLNPRLLPKVYDKKLLRIKFNNGFDRISGNYITESQQAIRDYVDTELITLRSTSEQMDYLKLCALLIIWNNDLSKHTKTELEKISALNNKELKKNAKLVIYLQEFYSNY